MTATESKSTKPSTWLHKARRVMVVPPDLPERFSKAEWSNLPPGDVAEQTRRFLVEFWKHAPFGRAPVFLGRAREWKTYAAAVIVRRVHHYGNIPTHFFSCPADMSVMDADRYSVRTQDELKRLQTIPLLVMDDFAEIKPDSYGADVLRAVISARHQNLRPTIWTANLEVDDDFEVMGKLYGPSFARRLRDGGAGFTVIRE